MLEFGINKLRNECNVGCENTFARYTFGYLSFIRGHGYITLLHQCSELYCSYIVILQRF